MTTYFTGKGYGLSNITDITGRPLLTFQGPEDKKPFLISDRVAQTFDFTVAQQLTAGAMRNDRLASDVASFVKSKLGGGTDDELDHKISLELGGSNTPANLFIQHGIAQGASGASDELENTLALDVVAGRISLLQAWRTLADQKGFLLGEDAKTGTSFSFSQIASSLFQIGTSLRFSTKSQTLGKMDDAMKAQMADDVTKLAQDPLNQPLQEKIFSNNVAAATTTLSLTGADARKVTKSFIGAYGESKGIDPREMVGALNLNIQKIIDNSKTNPNVFGVPTPVIINIIGALQSVSTLAVTGGLVLAIIGIFLAGPEAILGALSGGLLESIGAIFGVSALTGIGLTSFAFGEALTVASIGMGMTIKQTYDNTYLLPTQQISSLKDALAVQKGLASFLPSAVTVPGAGSAAKPSGATGASVPSVAVAPVKIQVFTGVVANGTLGSPSAFTPMANGMITDQTQLLNSAMNNLSAYLVAVPGLLYYEVAVVSSVKTRGGFIQKGGSVQIRVGTTKTGKPIMKTIFNKFAVVNVGIRDMNGKTLKLGQIVLGPVDSTHFNPTVAQLATVATQITPALVTTNVAAITGIQTSSPVTVTPPPQVVSAPAPVVSTPASSAPAPVFQGPAINPQTGAYVPVPTATTSAPATPASVPTAPAPVPVATVTPAPVPVVTPVVVAPKPLTAQQLAVKAATNLSEFYAALGSALPSISLRAAYYQQNGLGPSSTYVGSAEQNTALLNFYKRQFGVL